MVPIFSERCSSPGEGLKDSHKVSARTGQAIIQGEVPPLRSPNTGGKKNQTCHDQNV